MPPENHFRLQEISRERKLELFFSAVAPRPEEVILDIGSARTSFFLKEVDASRVIALDVSEEKLRDHRHRVLGRVVADATALPLKDGAVDLVFSNAVIEHVGGLGRQRHFAREVRRVARRGYFVTTPNKLFPFEFHFRLPLFQFVPKGIQRWLNRYFTLGWVRKGQWEDINLLTPGQFQRLFPSARVVQQRVTVYPETLICYEVRAE